MCLLAAAAARSGSAGATSSSRTTAQLTGVEPTPVSSSSASRELLALALQPLEAATAAAAVQHLEAQVDCYTPC